ncbi:hypothetical protein [Lentzea nigeriaca]|uniref:hypothetical protein n=1 Tax=Lentzea nigeriaca TaxID=1128665 RepID=UPI00195A7549|nr:hypothetical protein [Lentzea nigeriaca]MBM7863764.1 hypothetical protein [Lentzea nigeriaca]
MPGDPDDRTGAARGFAFTCAALLALTIGIAVTYLPTGVVGDSINARQDTAKLIWPMAWRFYVNSAEREFTVAYRQSGDSFVPLTRPAADARYQYGLNRTSYGDMARLVSAARSVQPGQWRDCDAADIAGCSGVITEAPRTPIPDRFAPHVCGPVVFAVERPSADRTTRRVTRVAAVELTC